MRLNKRFFVTTPIYYVNDLPHIGHTYTTVAADVVSRWRRLMGDDVLFLTGTDEHGAKILEAAAGKKKDVREYCDEIAAGFKNAWKDMGVSYDIFIRTTDPLHEDAVRKFTGGLNEKKELNFSKYEGRYCIQCEKYLTETELSDGLCPDHKTKPVAQSEENYFFNLSKYREKLLEIIQDTCHPQHFEILPAERKNEITGKLKKGLDDISISRAEMPWGIPLPFDPGQTVYVWVDALINYISAVGYGLPGQKNLNYAFSDWWPADVHIIGKDILWFHCVIWPALLLASGLPLPKKIFAHGYFTVNGQKMSKTVGNVIRPAELIDIFGADASRFLLLAAFPFGSDGDISLDDFREKYNAYLANNIGNLISRTTNMVEKYSGGRLTVPAGWTDSNLQEIRQLFSVAAEGLESLSFEKTIRSIISMSTFCNQYIDREEPWRLASSVAPSDRQKLQKILYEVILVLKHITLLLAPLMPETSAKIWGLLDEKEEMAAVIRGMKDKPGLSLPSGAEIKKSPPLFPKQ
ncbi:MAG: methionine--tRNA ligase [Elusimicrobiota bacterium]